MFVDTSALIALLDADDARHADSVRTLEWLRENAELVTTNYVQIEALAVVRRRLGRDAASGLRNVLFPLIRVIWVDEATHVAAIATFEPDSSSASIVDRISFAVMRREVIEYAFAYDEDFQREGFDTLTGVQRTAARRVHETPATYGGDDASDLVSVAEIAVRSGRSINTIQSWRRRHDDFPMPLQQLAAGPIWNWPTIAAWIAAR